MGINYLNSIIPFATINENKIKLFVKELPLVCISNNLKLLANTLIRCIH